MGLFDWLKPGASDPAIQAAQAASAQRQQDIQQSLRSGRVPSDIAARLEGSRNGTQPWIATLTPAELLIARSHGFRPIAAISATCWLHYGWSWTEGHAQGWEAALRRLRAEARACGANAVVDVKMRSIALAVENSMDFTLIGTAVRVEGLPASEEPVIATVPALEFVKLLDADIVPTGIAIGAHYQWMTDWRDSARMTWMGNVESRPLSQLWESVRQRAHADLRQRAASQGNGVLAHVNFSQMFEREGDPKQYLGRHIVVATVVDVPGAQGTRGRWRGSDTQRSAPLAQEFKMVVDVHAGGTPLTGSSRHHQAYQTNDEDGAI